MQASAIDPVTGVPPIPAMTTDTERETYYRLAKETAGQGAIVEFGAWLGASTAYLAAGVRDSGASAKVHVFDKFVSKPGHVAKVKRFFDKRGMAEEELPVGDAYSRFLNNLGALASHVSPRKGQIEDVRWNGGPIALLVSDAPKRVPAISAVLTNFRSGLVPGTLMVWQDFCHFPSYEIPACLYRLREHLEFVEALVPGTTVVLRVRSQWTPAEVTAAALAVKRFSAEETGVAWDYWLRTAVPSESRGLFLTGRALFLCDLGEHAWAIEALQLALETGDDRIIAKLKYIEEARPDLFARYRGLFDHLGE